MPAGGSLCLLPFSPQQAMVSSLLMAQVWCMPAVRALKVPAGASLCPASFSPQQAMVSSLLMAQV